jgi:hypothetical protein
VNENQVNENQEVRLGKRRSREEIKRLVVAYEASGEGATDFCRTHHLAWSVLKKRRLSKVESKEVKRLVPVALLGAKGNGDTARPCALEVVLSSGRRIEVRPDFDSGTLERLLKVLEKG